MISRSEFAQQIRKALENIHDSVSLQRLSLSALLANPERTTEQSVRYLRTLLLETIESLEPESRLPPRAKERRPFAILYGRYVQGMETNELVEELAISMRQLRREHQRALTAIVERMWETLRDELRAPNVQPMTPHAIAAQAMPSSFEEMPGGNDAIQAETAHLITHAKAEHLQIQILINDILAMLSPLTAERRVELQNCLPDTLPSILAPRTVLRQAIFELLAYALDIAAAGQLVLQASVDQTLNLSIWAKGAESTDWRSTVGLEVSQSLLSGLSAKLTITNASDAWQSIVHLPVVTPRSILVIDDNSSLVELFRRYIAGHPYYLHHAYTVQEALDYAGQNKVSLILLDIMMPERDGWEVLQQLKRYTTTREIPIIICSVIHEPEIAKMLGAADYLVKPVLPDSLLEKIEVWCDG